MVRSQKGTEIGEKILKRLEAVARGKQPFTLGDVKLLAALIIELEREAYDSGVKHGRKIERLSPDRSD